MDNNELKKFYHTLQQDIRTDQISDEEGGMLEQIFTQSAANLLSESGEVENVRVAYDEKLIKTGVQHKINAYAVADNYETIDLFISIYNGTDEIAVVSKAEIDKAARRITSFFKNAVYKEYVAGIEESSEIFQLALSLSESQDIKENLVRINAIILTDGLYNGENPAQQNIYSYPIFYRVVDINYLYNISEKSHIPIEIDFKADGFRIPCIQSPSVNNEYESYLAIIPAEALVNIYERFGSRLLEQNVRSFLQFTGKVNGGIRKTILHEPHMFLAFNNGIAATADAVNIELSVEGTYITKINDLQIVNGGQTTASIYHTWRKDKKDVSGVFVQLKLSVIKNKEQFGSIVSRISEYANTQNKVSIADLSSNRPFHIELEKLSRNIWTPASGGQSLQTRWFYERARGQYKNARIKEGFTKNKQKAFDLKNPKNQVFTKEDLAKYANAYQEVANGRKINIGPHYVVRGNQKNYVQFINYNLPQSVDNVYFEDIVAKSLLFKAAEKRYGIKPNSIGDMRYITVPYSIAWLSYQVKNKIDLYKIWKNQSISEALSDTLYEIMIRIEQYIKGNAPGSLYGEWAKKEECWLAVREQTFGIDLSKLNNDLEDSKKQTVRRRITDDDSHQANILLETEKVKAIPAVVWSKIEDWGRTSGKLSMQQQNVSWNISSKLRSNTAMSDYERNAALRIIDLIAEHNPELLNETDEEGNSNPIADPPIEINIDTVKKIIDWDKRNKRLKSDHYKYLVDIADGKIQLTIQAQKKIKLNLERLAKYGFKI
ncbi:abortive phage resistance protein [Chitinophaga flava]|uniref:Abortive phage resistance protein n=2 Tax=Chitinophaga flava TaxID=2259036 RepID=A0A365Y7A3_9BACT|nr:abortive phage resistance protein [Chitinophaga flava]